MPSRWIKRMNEIFKITERRMVTKGKLELDFFSKYGIKGSFKRVLNAKSMPNLWKRTYHWTDLESFS